MEDTFALRLLLILMSSLTKISIRFKFLIPRTKVLLSQVIHSINRKDNEVKLNIEGRVNRKGRIIGNFNIKFQRSVSDFKLQ